MTVHNETVELINRIEAIHGQFDILHERSPEGYATPLQQKMLTRLLEETLKQCPKDLYLTGISLGKGSPLDDCLVVLAAMRSAIDSKTNQCLTAPEVEA